MSTIVIANTSQPAAALLVETVWNALVSKRITSPGPWPFDADSLDFGALGNVTLTIAAQTGLVTLSFSLGTAPVFTGTLDLTLLTALLA